MRAQIAREYRKKYGMQMPTRALAQILYDENKAAYKDFEDARSALRYIEGKYGKANKKK